jgi:hypothetical protein
MFCGVLYDVLPCALNLVIKLGSIRAPDQRSTGKIKVQHCPTSVHCNWNAQRPWRHTHPPLTCSGVTDTLSVNTPRVAQSFIHVGCCLQDEVLLDVEGRNCGALKLLLADALT